MPTYPVPIPRFGLGRPTNQPVLNPEWALGANFAALIDDRSGYNLVNRAAPGTITGTLVSGVSPPISLSRGYGSTFGVGTTDKLITGFSRQATLRTFAAWAYRGGIGGGGFGRVLGANNTTETDTLFWSNELGFMSYYRGYSLIGGFWSFPSASAVTSAWTLLVVTYDSGSTSNDPLGYLNGLPVTLTEQSTPTGSLNTVADAYLIGNEFLGVSNWDGFIGPVMIWDRLLSPFEAWSLYDPLTRWDMYWQPSQTAYFYIAPPPPGPGGIYSVAIPGNWP